MTNVKVFKELNGRRLSQKEINQLFKVCFLNRTPQGFRDAALIGLLRDTRLKHAAARLDVPIRKFLSMSRLMESAT